MTRTRYLLRRWLRTFVFRITGCRVILFAPKQESLGRDG